VTVRLKYELMKSDDKKMERFVALYAANQKRIYRYLASLLPNSVDLEDVLQETSVVLWREFESFQPGTNFGAWSCRVAFHQVLAWRKRQQRDRLIFSDRFLEVIGTELVENVSHYDERELAIQNCVEKLPLVHQKILKARYRGELSIESIAENFQKTTDAVYRLLSRIRQSLQKCVDRSLSGGEVN